MLTIGNKQIFLDAGNKNNSFGLLDDYCYNGLAWAVGENGQAVTLSPDSISDKSTFFIKIFDFNDTSAKMEIIDKEGMISSEILRKKWDRDVSAKSIFVNDLIRNMPAEISITSSNIDNADLPDTNLVVKYTCVFHFEQHTNTFFINALMIHFFEENPVKSITRVMPVEFAHRIQRNYFMNIILPENIAPDSVSQPTRVSYNHGNMLFKKDISYFDAMRTLSVHAGFEVNNTVYEQDELSTIRTFFQRITDENSEVISFKKTGSR